MKIKQMRSMKLQWIAALCCLCAHASLADDALFIGNSYTYGGPEMIVTNHGGVPKLVEAIAASKGKTLTTLMITKAGKDLAYHLAKGTATKAVSAKKWNWVVLQDFSDEATHAGNLDAFFKSADTFYRQISQSDPEAKVVLYEPWARPADSPFYTGKSTARTFINVGQMNEEIQKNYLQLAGTLGAMEPGDHVELAPVGQAFERSLEENPGIDLYFSDKHHANVSGDYLAALVIYATLYKDNPEGATRSFFGTEVEPEVAAKLQAVAKEVSKE
jgi:hypothetical protein